MPQLRTGIAAARAERHRLWRVAHQPALVEITADHGPELLDPRRWGRIQKISDASLEGHLDRYIRAVKPALAKAGITAEKQNPPPNGVADWRFEFAGRLLVVYVEGKAWRNMPSPVQLDWLRAKASEPDTLCFVARGEQGFQQLVGRLLWLAHR